MLTDLDIKESQGVLSLAVKVVPRASRSAVAGVRERALLLRLQAPPVEGKANACLITFLAELLGLRKNQLKIKTGDKSRSKIVQISGLSLAELRKILADALPDAT